MTKRCPKCNQPIRKIRSVPQHRRFFAMIKAARFHWPENHRHQFADDEALRKWLTIKAEYFVSEEIDLDESATPAMVKLAVLGVEATMRAYGNHGIIRPRQGGFTILKAKSIAFDQLSHEKFCTLNDAVAEVIEAETGLPVEQLLKETEDAA